MEAERVRVVFRESVFRESGSSCIVVPVCQGFQVADDCQGAVVLECFR